MAELWHALVGGMTSLMTILYHFTLTLGIGSYGLAIILLTIIIKNGPVPFKFKANEIHDHDAETGA